MRLTTFTDFSLRMLVHLALKPQGRVTIADVAKAYGISENHLMKVAQLLGQEGFVRAMRGRGGGLVLARPAAEITVGQVVRRLEPDFDLVPCFAGGCCAILPVCRLKQALRTAREAFLAMLDATTLEEIAQPKAELRELLGIGS